MHLCCRRWCRLYSTVFIRLPQFLMAPILHSGVQDDHRIPSPSYSINSASCTSFGSPIPCRCCNVNRYLSPSQLSPRVCVLNIFLFVPLFYLIPFISPSDLRDAESNESSIKNALSSVEREDEFVSLYSPRFCILAAKRSIAVPHSAAITSAAILTFRISTR